MKVYFLIAYFLIQSMSIFAQQQELKMATVMPNENNGTNATTLLDAFKNGKVNGHFRYFFLGTDNQHKLTDYYANALGGRIKFETAKFYGFQIAVGGYYTFNLGSSDFSKPDSITNQFNRYESSLFDIEKPSSKNNLAKLQELYIKYQFKKSNIILGRQIINTPFVNTQDGRMIPTCVSGVWLNINHFKKMGIEGGWLNGISPRGTMKTYNPGASIGLYPSGINIDGSKSNYSNHIQSAGIGLLGVNYTIYSKLNLQLWNLFAENIFNTEMIQLDWNHRLKDSSSFFAAFQGIHQVAINDGGNADVSKTYFTKGQQTFAFGGKIGWRNKKLETSISYNRITANGRFLMPREWGRDPFFTFMPRERNEGLGNVDAVVAKLNYNFPKSNFKTSISYGYFHLPDVKNYKLNKYGMPSYTQLNADFRYVCNGQLKGFETQLLIVSKFNQGNTYKNDKYVFNKVNMIQYNFVVNYNF